MMTDTERGILAAILSEPGDDTHRLVYADYLQESGREKRARFIRCQIPSTHDSVLMPDGSTADIKVKSGWMIQEWGIDELAGFPVPEEIRPVFRRGFVEEVACTAEAFLRHADAMLLLTPLRKATLTTLPEVQGKGWGRNEVAWLVEPVENRFWKRSEMHDALPCEAGNVHEITRWAAHALLLLRFPGVEFVLPTSTGAALAKTGADFNAFRVG